MTYIRLLTLFLLLSPLIAFAQLGAFAQKAISSDPQLEASFHNLAFAQKEFSHTSDISVFAISPDSPENDNSMFSAQNENDLYIALPQKSMHSLSRVVSQNEIRAYAQKTKLNFEPLFFDQKKENPLSLDQAISKGLRNSYRLEINDRNIKLAQNNNTWGRAGKYPTVSAGVALNNNLTEETNQASFLRGEYLNASLTPSVNMNWNLYNGGLVNYQKQLFENTVSLQETSQAIEVQNTVRSIQQAYFTVLLEENRLGVLNDIFTLSKDRLSYQLIRKEYGQGNSFSIIQFEDALLADSTNLLLQQNAIKNARQQLLLSMNEDIATDYYALSDQLSTSLEPLKKDDIRSKLIENNPSIKLLELNRQIASINQRIAKTGMKPSVSLTSGVTAAYSLFQIFGTNPQTGDDYPLLDGQTYRWTTGINASYPLYNGGVIKANIENARLQEEIAQFDVLESTAALMTQLDILFNNYETQLQLVGILDERLKTAQRNITIAEERLNSGAIGSLDYRNIQLGYLNTSFSRISAIYNLLTIKTDIAFLVAQ